VIGSYNFHGFNRDGPRPNGRKGATLRKGPISRLTESRNFRVGDNTSITQLLAPSPFFNTYPFDGVQVAVNDSVALLDSIEDHAEADRRTQADLPLEKTVQMSGTASSLIR